LPKTYRVTLAVVNPRNSDWSVSTFVAGRSISLKAGWNEIRFRGYCAGYPPFRAGRVLAGPEDKLWTLRVSDSPPAEK
jgi:hypothetical protein